MNKYEFIYSNPSNFSTVVRTIEAKSWHCGENFTHFFDKDGKAFFSVRNELVISVEVLKEEPKDVE